MLNLMDTIQVVFQTIVIAFVGFFLGAFLLEQFRKFKAQLPKKEPEEKQTDAKQ